MTNYRLYMLTTFDIEAESEVIAHHLLWKLEKDRLNRHQHGSVKIVRLKQLKPEQIFGDAALTETAEAKPTALPGTHQKHEPPAKARGVIRHRRELCIGCDTDCAPATMQGLRCAGCSRVICAECAYRECVLCNAFLGLHQVCKCESTKNGLTGNPNREYRHVPTRLLCVKCPRSRKALKRLKEERADGTLAVKG